MVSICREEKKTATFWLDYAFAYNHNLNSMSKWEKGRPVEGEETLFQILSRRDQN